MAHVYFPNHAPNATAGPSSPQHSMTHSARRQLQDEQRARKAAAMMKNPCEIVLVRHGETAWNKEGRLQGQQEPGPPLDDLGQQQAAVAAQVLLERFPRVDAVYSSDLLRAVQTAEVVAAAYKLQVKQHTGLRERHMGILQGLTYTEAPHAQPEGWAALQSDSTSTKVPGGESLDEVRERLTAAVLDVAQAYPGQRVVLISHGGALHSIHRAARGYQAKGKVFNCSISILMAEADTPLAAAAAGSDTQQRNQQSRQGNASATAAAGNGQQHSHLDAGNSSALGLKGYEVDGDSIAVVWCDPSELCEHCSSSSSSGGRSSDHHDNSHSHSHAHSEAHAHHAAHAADSTVAASSTNGGTASTVQLPSTAEPSTSGSGKPSRSSSLHNPGLKQCGGGRVRGGRLALLSWNDSFALQAAHLQSDKAFGGSSRAG